MSGKEEGPARTKLRRATEEFIPEIQQKPSIVSPQPSIGSNMIQFGDIIQEWNYKYQVDLMAVQKYKFNAEFPRLISYKEPAEIRKKFESAHSYNLENIKLEAFKDSVFVYVQAEAYDDLHKVDSQ